MENSNLALEYCRVGLVEKESSSAPLIPLVPYFLLFLISFPFGQVEEDV